MATPNYIPSLLALYEACSSQISLILTPDQDIASYCPNYLFQMTLASGFALLKLLSSPAIEWIDAPTCKRQFNAAIVAVRRMSVTNNDLPGRMAEVLVQLKARGGSRKDPDNWESLRLRLRGRMSMSVTFDSLWEWRKGFEWASNRTELGRSDPQAHSFVSVYSIKLIFTLVIEDSTSNSVCEPTAQSDANQADSPSLFQQDFNLEDLAFDEFYPMNWILENTPEMPH
jgi:hypothetical protein